MASPSAPPVVPVTNHQQQPKTDEAAAQPPSALRSFINNINDTVRNGLSNRRPWTELVDRTAIAKPESMSEATSRIRKNYAYFRINYLTIITCVLGFSLITHPFSLLLLTALLGAWLFLYLFRSPADPPIVLFGRQFSNKETIGALLLSTVVVIFLTSVGYVLVSALMVGVAIVCAHAAFRAPEDLFLDEQDSPAIGFLSFLTGAANNAASPVLSARV